MFSKAQVIHCMNYEVFKQTRECKWDEQYNRDAQFITGTDFAG